MKVKRDQGSILLTGASGKLGSAIRTSNFFSNLLCPSLNELDITKIDSIFNFIFSNKIKTVIHCAAQARMSYAEKNPINTIETNIIGTANLVIAVLKKEYMFSNSIRFIHISTDGIYRCDYGSYTEESPTIPYNKYGWTKLGSECSVNLLSNYCIVRTAFFDPENIPFNDSAVDGYSSKLSLKELVGSLKVIVESDFVGTVNIGSEKMSDYERYKKYKPLLEPTTYQAIQKDLPFKLYQDASMDITKWKTLKKSKKSAKKTSTKTIDTRSCL